VKRDEFILETALDHDIDIPFSCQSGLCTTCRGKLVSGKVRMEDPDGLSDAEIAEGYILTCVSHPDSQEIKIEIG
jgi:ring-1,2-phenylacetyl-CoA epoxidase subunit PaaE